jgi:hypothetical protein
MRYSDAFFLVLQKDLKKIKRTSSSNNFVGEFEYLSSQEVNLRKLWQYDEKLKKSHGQYSIRRAKVQIIHCRKFFEPI